MMFRRAITFFRFALLNFSPFSSNPLVGGNCPKHEVLLDNFKPNYFLDKGEIIEVWAQLIPEPWEDNRVIGSLSNTEYLTFNLRSWETSSEKQGIGVISRNVTAAVKEKQKQIGNKKVKATEGLNETPGNVLFTIKAFSEDPSCITLKAETNITIGCPVNRHILPRGKPVCCDGYENYSFVIPRHQRRDVFLSDQDVTDKVFRYDFARLGCPFTLLKNEPFKPIIDLYDGETFIKEVRANYILWEQHGRTGYTYSTTMKQAGCIREAQSWEKMIKSVQAEEKDSAWSKLNYRSCFEEPANNSSPNVDLNQPYEILNSSISSSQILWNDVGIFVFTLKVVDPEFSFCNLTVEISVQVNAVRGLMEEIPTFVVLGSSSLIIIIMVVSAYYTLFRCVD